jgi:dipeptidyl aminopeptidase/acylaminoacyl peptidase
MNKTVDGAAHCATIRLLATSLLTFAVALSPQLLRGASVGEGEERQHYSQPDEAVTRLLTATPPPEPLVHASSGRVALLFRQPVVSLERLARPFLGLAGFRFDPLSRTSGVSPLVEFVEIINVSGSTDQRAMRWELRPDEKLDHIHFSPNGRYLSALKVGVGGSLALVLFDLHTGVERRLNVPVNAAWGEPCQWVDEQDMLCRVLPEDPPPIPTKRMAPVVLEHQGGPSPTRTYNNLLQNANEDALFEYFFTGELARVSIDGSMQRIAQTRGLFSKFTPSADGNFTLITRLQQPYPRLVPARRFPNVLEVWDLAEGKRVFQSRPAGFGVGKVAGVPDRPRRVAWKPGSSHTVGFIERQVSADAKSSGDAVYRWLSVAAPFDREPQVIVSSDQPIDRFGWTSAGTPYFFISDEDGAGVTAFIVAADGAAQQVWSGRAGARYMDAGKAIKVDGRDGPVLEIDGRIFIAGHGLSEIGPRPFLDAYNLKTQASERLFTSDAGVFEEVLAVLDADGPVLLTSRETETTPPNLYRVKGRSRLALRPLSSPYPDLDKVERRVIRYRRDDNVALSGTLYLPQGWQDGDEPLPTLVWIYPYEFQDQEHAERMDVRGFRYHKVKGPSPLAAVLEGYAVLLNPTVPIVGEGSEVNDTYVKQLVASAEAAVDYLVDGGISDAARIAVGGRSYGAFSSANLLVHSRRFATAISMSGAYNRTLTPFGFQHEKRSFWQAADMYTSISPFFHADKIEAPILLVHGGADPNPGTPTLQAKRFFHALVGEGVPVRYVELPFEGHHYWARESVLDASREMIDWLDRILAPTEAVEEPQTPTQ